MGSGVLPTTIHNNTLYFLFGKENKFADTPGWSDFGGGTEQGESFLETASREASEESTGFLGSKKEIKKQLLKSAPITLIFQIQAQKMCIECIYYPCVILKNYHIIITITKDFYNVI